MGITSSSLGIESLVSSLIFRRPSVTGSPDIFFVSGDGWETLSNDFWGDVPRLLRRWETPLLGAFALQEMLPFPSLFSLILAIILILAFCLLQ